MDHGAIYYSELLNQIKVIKFIEHYDKTIKLLIEKEYTYFYGDEKFSTEDLITREFQLIGYL